MKELKLRFNAELKHISLVLEICRLATTDQSSFLLAITEALNNAVEHSGTAEIQLELHFSPGEIEAIIITEGVAFDSSQVVGFPAPELQAEGGFGLPIIQHLSDAMEYSYLNGKNILILKKKI
ncbi:MAG: hypothetical protein COB67_05320 [SAR324 cluster bacterium]|uniref:Histidine kinase/HSP90-like ATPase domain-containing protein n=1 Tax=SAR324 cluster bacterium TaxID=2024889 RepID=A0A2A4T6F8_9DELT|nr:MAG: hypothetical protein COB67_05320 [SAR324 cluster bacterium]